MPLENDVQNYIHRLSDAFFKVSTKESSAVITDYKSYIARRDILDKTQKIITDIKMIASIKQAISQLDTRIDNITVQRTQIARYKTQLNETESPYSRTLNAQLTVQDTNLELLEQQTVRVKDSLISAEENLTNLKNML